MFSGFFSHSFEEFLSGGNHVHIPGNCFNDHAGDFVAFFVKEFFELFGIVVFQNDRVVCDSSGDTGRARCTEGQQAGAAFNQQGIAVAVVAAFKLHNLIAAGVAASPTDGAHAGFGAGGDETDFFNGRNETLNFFGNINFNDGRSTEAQAVVNGFFDSFNDVRIVVTEDHRTPRSDVVDVLLTFDVVHVRP